MNSKKRPSKHGRIPGNGIDKKNINRLKGQGYYLITANLGGSSYSPLYYIVALSCQGFRKEFARNHKIFPSFIQTK